MVFPWPWPMPDAGGAPMIYTTSALEDVRIGLKRC